MLVPFAKPSEGHLSVARSAFQLAMASRANVQEERAFGPVRWPQLFPENLACQGLSILKMFIPQKPGGSPVLCPHRGGAALCPNAFLWPLGAEACMLCKLCHAANHSESNCKLSIIDTFLPLSQPCLGWYRRVLWAWKQGNHIRRQASCRDLHRRRSCDHH